MSRSRGASCMLAVVALYTSLLAGRCEAKTINVPWTTGARLAPISAVCGDTLSFASNGFHDIVQVASGSCNAAVVKTLVAAPAPATSLVTLTAAGKTTYICTIGGHCSGGQMLVNVTTTCPKPPPPPKSPPPPPPKAKSPLPKAKSPPPKAKSPPPKPAAVTIPVAWTFRSSPLVVNARCGDSISFNINGGFHSIVKVSAGTCTASSLATIAAAPAATTVVKLTAAGTTFYKCDVSGHCSSGMLLTVNTVGPC